MAETTFGLPAFLRLVSLERNKIVSELKQRKFRGLNGGPPTRIAMTKAMRSVTYDGESEQVALDRLLGAVPRRQLSHIRTMFHRFCRIMGQPTIRPTSIPVDANYRGPLNVINVIAVPEVSYYRGGNQYIVQHWYTKGTLLSSRLRRLGYAIMQGVDRDTAFKARLVAIQDLVAPRFASELEAAPLLAQEVDAILQSIETVWIDIEEDTRPLDYVREHGDWPLI